MTDSVNRLSNSQTTLNIKTPESKDFDHNELLDPKFFKDITIDKRTGKLVIADTEPVTHSGMTSVATAEKLVEYYAQQKEIITKSSTPERVEGQVFRDNLKIVRNNLMKNVSSKGQMAKIGFLFDVMKKIIKKPTGNYDSERLIASFNKYY